MPESLPFVTVVMPVRNEAGFIRRSLQSVLEQDYPADRMEVIVADGMSTDETRRIVESSQAVDDRVRLIDNPQRIVPTALNGALRLAQGSVLIRVDGHCEIAPDYVARCVEHLRTDGIDAVGGSVETLGENSRSDAIALAMSSAFGVGGAKFRTVHGQTLLVDTVAFPAYKREVIDRAGSFDEELIRNQDDEYNYRLRKQGARILLASDVNSRYYCRGTWASLWRQYFEYGYWKVRVMQKHLRQMKARQFVPPLFVLMLAASLLMAPFSEVTLRFFGVVWSLYFLSSILASAVFIGTRPLSVIWRLPVTFAVMHLSYGIGFLVGLIHFRRRWGESAQVATAADRAGVAGAQRGCLPWVEKDVVPVPLEGLAPRVSVVMPCRNEKDSVETCLRSLLEQKMPEGGFEVLVVDGMSNDGTRAILERLAAEERVHVLDNPAQITPAGMNVGIREARGEYIAIVGAHNRYASDYLRRSVAVLEETGADNVGGAMFYEAGSLFQDAVAAAHYSPFSVGGARWHRTAYEGHADTVFGGVYRRSVFARIGLFDEELVRNQDDEMNLRLSRAGGRIWQSPTIRSWYKPRKSLRELFRQQYQYGYWKVRVIQKHRAPSSARHLVPGCFVLALFLLSLASIWTPKAAWAALGLLGLYLAASAIASLQAASRSGWKVLPILPFIFGCYHFAYGLGFLHGVVDFFLLKRGPGHALTGKARS